MRPSNRDKMLDAAYRVVERDGVAGVTFEAVAEESGVSRGGLLYHFNSKDELLLALHEYLATRWEARLVEELGTAPDQATPDQRVAAYARVSARSATGPELLLIIEASLHADLRRPWSTVAAKWLPDPSSVSPDDEVAVNRLLAVLAADGLWVSDSVGELHVPPKLRAALADRIADMLNETAAE